MCKLDCQQDNSCPGAEIDCPAPDSDAAADVGALTPQCILGCGSEGACRPQLIEASDDGYDTTAGEDYYTEGVTVIDFTRYERHLICCVCDKINASQSWGLTQSAYRAARASARVTTLVAKAAEMTLLVAREKNITLH